MEKMDDIDVILDFYNKREEFTEMDIKLWCNKFLIRQINTVLSDSENQKAENCINLIFSLFFFQTPDNYSKNGKEINNLKQREKKKLFKILKSEFYN